MKLPAHANIAEAYSSIDADLWKEAMQSEMDSIMSKDDQPLPKSH